MGCALPSPGGARKSSPQAALGQNLLLRLWSLLLGLRGIHKATEGLQHPQACLSSGSLQWVCLPGVQTGPPHVWLQPYLLYAAHPRPPQGCQTPPHNCLFLWTHICALTFSLEHRGGFPDGASGKEPTCQCRRSKRCEFDPWGQEDPLEEDMATHSNILAWQIPWTEEPGRLWSIGLQRVRHD